MSVQRSTFELIAGLNRVGDPLDTIVPSEVRPVSKAMDVGGCFAVTSATDGGDLKFQVLIEGSNDFDDADPSAAIWLKLFQGLSTVLDDPAVNPQADTQFLDPLNQQISVLQFAFIRVTIVVVSGLLSTVNNLQTRCFFKFDYRTG